MARGCPRAWAHGERFDPSLWPVCVCRVRFTLFTPTDYIVHVASSTIHACIATPFSHRSHTLKPNPRLAPMALATMPSPPGNHPFMRPAISATPSPPGSLHQPGAAYYQSIANPNLAPPSADGRSASSRPASSLSATPSGPPRPLSAQTPRSTAGARFSVNGTPNGSTNGHAAPYREGPDVPRKLSRWEEKVQGDLAGWRGGHG